MNDAKRITLKEFIGENSVLFSALAVFVAIFALMGKLSINWLNSALSFIFLGGMIIILHEIQSYFPKDKNGMSVRLILFNYVILLSLWGILLYWLLAFRTFWNVFLAIPIFILLVIGMTNSTIKLLARKSFFVKIFGIGQKKNVWQVAADVIYCLVIIFLSFIYAGIFTPIINIILNATKIYFH